jgi:glycosyltransferase involved in cell wall biosynthesis
MTGLDIGNWEAGTAECYPRVSVIIPCYNAVGFVEETIASAFAQTYGNVEVIVVDDGSTDGSYEHLLRLRESRFANLKVLTHAGRQNLGVSMSRFRGVANCSGEFVAWLDADDQFAPSKVARQVSVLREHEEVVLCHTGIRAFGSDADHSLTEEHFSNHPTSPYRLRKRRSYLRVNAINNSSVMVRKSALLAVPFAMPQVFQFEDWLCWNLLAHQGFFLFLDEPLTLYRMHSASASAGVHAGTVKDLYATLEMKVALFAKSKNSREAAAALWSAQRTVSELVELYAEAEQRLRNGSASSSNLCVVLFRQWWRVMRVASRGSNKLKALAGCRW